MRILAAFAILLLQAGAAQAAIFRLTLRQAEAEAVAASDRLKSSESDAGAADSQRAAALAQLFPKLALQGTYQYNGYIPKIQIGPGAPVSFGTNSTYTIGPSLSYVVWDSLGAISAYKSAARLASARAEDFENARAQLVASVRSAYVQVQLAFEELGLVDQSRALAKAQDRDVTNRYRAGAADKLDLVTAHRGVLSDDIQFHQQQAALSASLKDLLALLGDRPKPRDVSRPGPAGVAGVTLALELDPLQKLLGTLGAEARVPRALGDDQPQIKSLDLQARAADSQAWAQTSRLLPIVQVSGSVVETQPNMPTTPAQFAQEAFGVSVSMPLFLGDPTWGQAAQQRALARSARFRADQAKTDLNRDYGKARELLASLREQRKLALQDVEQTELAAKLYYTSYKNGKINLIEVQNANVQALQSKVNAARIDAQILSQVIALKALAGTESNEGKESAND